MFIKSNTQHITFCQRLDAADMSHSLKMVELWQPCHPWHNTVEGWMPPVNIYLPCECVPVCGAARRQELLWGFICSMTRQPVIYEHLELLFKHSLISRQTFPEARAQREWPRPDQTRPHTVSPYPTQPVSRVPGTQAGNSPSKCMCVCLCRVFWAQTRQLRTTVWHYSDGNHLRRVFLPSC